MGQPLRLEEFLPSPSEVASTAAPPPQIPELLRALRKGLEAYAAQVAQGELTTGRFIEGGARLVSLARQMGPRGVDQVEETVAELETWERALADLVRRVTRELDRRLRDAQRSRVGEVRGRFAELLRRDKAARGGTLRATRDLRWQLMAVIAEFEPVAGAKELRSLADIAELFGDEKSNRH